MSLRRVRPSRRHVLTAISTAISGGAVTSTAASAKATPWTAVPTPTGNTLFDVEYASTGAYAIGGGGIVLERTADRWQKILDGGPTGNGNSLYGSDVTDDGVRLWFVGASGAIGEYDVTTGNLSDRSAPMDVTNNFNDIAVTGPAGDANVYVAGDSGKLYYSFENGAAGTWEYVTPANGSNVNAVDFYGRTTGHIVDGNKAVLHTRDGETWEKIGVADANVNFYGVDSDADTDVWVSGGGGIVFHWNGGEWASVDTGDASLRDLAVTNDDTGLTVGGGGAVYHLVDDVWTKEATPTGENLKAVVSGTPDVAVGAGGTIIER